MTVSLFLKKGKAKDCNCHGTVSTAMNYCQTINQLDATRAFVGITWYVVYNRNQEHTFGFVGIVKKIESRFKKKKGQIVLKYVVSLF